MANERKLPRLAVLIDADNASAKIADGLFEEIAKIGEASARRIYGDFSSPGSKAWADVLAKHAIMPQQQFAYVKGKNASDITLVIDAMDLLLSERFDGFCLVSSDSDFTRLAARIREQGMKVYGFGEQKTPESFRNACTRFIYTENLIENKEKPTEKDKPKAIPAKSLGAVEKLIAKALSQLDPEGNWVTLSAVGTQLANLASDFDPRSYGTAKLSDLVRKTGKFELEASETGSLRIRPKRPQ
jgi:uncharacterized LabA/DUF88 family protein